MHQPGAYCHAKSLLFSFHSKPKHPLIFGTKLAANTLMQHQATDLKTLLEHMDSAILQISPQLEIVYLNPSAEMLLQKSQRQVTGHPLDELCQSNTELVKVARNTLETGQANTRRDFTLHLAHQKHVRVNLTTTPLSSSGLLIEAQWIGRLNAINQEAVLQNESTATRHLLRGLAHEIKNPLGGIRGAAQLLEYELDTPELREYTSVIIKETDRLRKLIDQMAGPRKAPDKKWINIHEVSERVRKLIQAESPDHVAVKFDYDPSLPDIFGDRDLLIQANLNLARNALESLCDQPGEIRFETRILRKHTIGETCWPLVVSLSIIDNGPGIPTALQPQVFFPMVTDKANGTGLGLSVAQSLVDAHNGLIRFTSAPSNTRFEILLPIVPGNP